MPDTLTQKWLRQNIMQYINKERLFADVDSVLNRYSTLHPKSDIYSFVFQLVLNPAESLPAYDDGRTQLMICIHGLLPISYRQASYNIPIAVWLTKDYPLQPPIAYVVPTSNMLVKAGKYIEVSGKCNIPYLLDWLRKPEPCNIAALLEAMQDHFSREPPVYSKPKESAPVTTSQSDSYPRKPPPITPSNPVVTNAPPTLPPKPGVDLNSPPSKPTFQSPSVPFGPSPPPASQEQLLQPPQYVTGTFRPSPPPLPPVYPFVQGPVTSHHHTGSSTTSQQQWSVSPPPPSMPSIEPTPQQGVIRTPIPNLLDEELLETHASSQPQIALAAAPPRPPNPELLHLHAQVHQKLTSELASIVQALALDAERLRAQQADLLLGEPAIRDEMARLDAVNAVCHNVADRISQVINQAELNVAELRRKGDPDVDELVCSTSIVHNQLINLAAEDNAIEDTIYHLHRALNSGRIDLERFLRTTRILAEEQFMKRALIEKIRTGISMDMSFRSSWG